MNVYSLTGILFLLLALFIYFMTGTRNRKSLVSLFTLFVFVWLLSLSLGAINAYHLYDASEKFYLLLILGLFFWICGFFCARLSKTTKITKRQTRRAEENGGHKREYRINARVMYAYIIFITIFTIIISLITLRLSAGGMSYAQLHSLAFGQSESELFDSSLLNLLYERIMYPMVLALVPICTIAFFRNENRKLALVSMLAIVLYCFLIGRRFPILYIGIDFVLIFAFYKLNISRKTVRRVILSVALLCFGIIIITAWRKDAFKTGDWSPVFRTYYTYFHLCLPLGDHWLQQVDTSASNIWTFGYSFFYGVFSHINLVLRQFGLHPFGTFNELVSWPDTTFVAVGPGHVANSFVTWIYFFYLDFRELGVAAGSFLFGWLVGKVEKKAFKDRNLLNIAIYLLISQAVFKSFVRWEFTYPAYVLSFFFMRFLLTTKKAPPPRQAPRGMKKRGIKFVWKMPIWLEEDDGKATGIREENVSFGVFDTLIRRSVARPADLFRIMEQNDPNVPEHFAEKRVEAERAAFAKLGARMGLADIYEELLPLYGNHTNDLMALEIQYEIAGCRPVADNIDLVNLCMEHDKNVFLLADTYLPSSVIRRMLDVCGVYHYDQLYVSCEEGACKADGSLFWKVLADQEIRPHELRHIGSDRQGDVTEPWRVGVHVKRGKKKDTSSVDKELPEDVALYERTLQACVRNCADDLDSNDARLGCETFGPLLAGFTAWLREQLRRDGIQDVYFLAGDGSVLKQAFDALEDGSFRTHSLYFPEQTADQDHEALLAYIRACGMQGRVALVDTGRQIIVQKTLESLIAENELNIQVKGYYVGLNPDTDGIQAVGYLYDQDKGKETLEKLSPITVLFDTVFHAQHGAVRRIAMRDGQPVPELDAYEYASDEGRICDEIAILRTYQAGALTLVREMNEAFPGGVPQIPGEAAILPLLRMGTNPTRHEAELWGDFRVFDKGTATLMARPKGKGAYLLHPGRLKRDYAASPWKIGFLRRLSRLPLSYDKIVKNR